jgi:hypothetical protein
MAYGPMKGAMAVSSLKDSATFKQETSPVLVSAQQAVDQIRSDLGSSPTAAGSGIARCFLTHLAFPGAIVRRRKCQTDQIIQNC